VTAPVIVFRVESGAGVGLGHLGRCAAVAAAADRAGARPLFVGTADGLRAVDRRFERLEIRHERWSLGDAAETREIAARAGAVATLLDTYEATPAYIDAVRPPRGEIAMFLDRAVDAAVDLAIYPSASSDAWGRGGRRRLTGPAFTPLAAPYWSLPPRETRASATRVLISLGGAAPGDRVGALLSAMRAAHPTAEIECVVGPFSDRASFVAAAGDAAARATVIDAPPSLAAALQRADLVVTGGGQTLYEAAACGTPAVAIEMAANQRLQMAAFEHLGTCRVGGVISDPDAAASAAHLAVQLLNRADLRAAMAAAGQAAIDGGGAERVARALLGGAPR
jgi:spore coat polysaccharide biosynthesis predicted glycosyltransferase SpsG